MKNRKREFEKLKCLGIFAAKFLDLPTFFKISKSLMLKLFLITVLGTTALVLDLYFKKHPDILKEIEQESKDSDYRTVSICLFSQLNTFSVKAPVYKCQIRKISSGYEKFSQIIDQIRNYQIYKTALKPCQVLFPVRFLTLFRQQFYYDAGGDPLPA